MAKTNNGKGVDYRPAHSALIDLPPQPGNGFAPPPAPAFSIGLVLLIALFSGLTGGLAALWLSSAATASADSGRALVAGELRLTDDSGRTRLLMTLLRGKPRLLMLDEAGEYRLEMGLGDTGEPHIWLRDQDGAAKVQVALTAKGRPAFRLADAKGRERAIVGLSEQGEPTMILRDENGKDRLALWSDKKESGLALADPSGRPIGSFSAEEKGRGRLSFFEPGGQAYRVVE